MSSLLRRLSPSAELVLINLIAFGPFAARALVELAERKTRFVFDDTRALQMIAIEVACGAIAVWILRARGWTLSSLNLRATLPQTLGGMLLFIGTGIAVSAVYDLAQAALGYDPGASIEVITSPTLPLLIALTLINPLYDELLLVAYNVEATAPHGAAFAITLSAFVRFLCHLEQGPSIAFTILPLGLLFAAVYWRWRRVWPLIVAHAVMDFVGMMPS